MSFIKVIVVFIYSFIIFFVGVECWIMKLKYILMNNRKKIFNVLNFMKVKFLIVDKK